MAALHTLAQSLLGLESAIPSRHTSVPTRSSSSSNSSSSRNACRRVAGAPREGSGSILTQHRISQCASASRSPVSVSASSPSSSPSPSSFSPILIQPSASTTQQAQKSAEADVMGLLLRERIVFLGAEMNDLVADAIVSQLLLLDAQDPNRDIRLFVNSPGGSISATMAVFDAINLCRCNVSTIAFGLAASTAALVLAGGTRGKRYAMPNTRIMMHQPLGGASGQAIDVEIQAKEIMYHKTNITRIVSEITGRPFDKVEKDMDRDRYMSPMEAVEYGLIDAVIDEQFIIPLQPMPERVKSRPEFLAADKDPRKFLIPTVPDSEIF